MCRSIWNTSLYILCNNSLQAKRKYVINKTIIMAKLGLCRNIKGPHPWSKLQSALYKVIDKDVAFQIHSCAYDIGDGVGIPRYWITVGKEIVWDFPKNAIWDDSDWFFFDEAKSISRLIKSYIDCPKDELLARAFNDRWKMVPYLLACDKRIGKRRLAQMLAKDEYSCVAWIIRKRLEPHKNE